VTDDIVLVGSEITTYHLLLRRLSAPPDIGPQFTIHVVLYMHYSFYSILPILCECVYIDSLDHVEYLYLYPGIVMEGLNVAFTTVFHMKQ
jgi:hypothetical protein